MAKVVSFDFGTTNSLISVVEGDRAINKLEDEHKRLPYPSVVCYQGDKVIVRRKAKERLSSWDVGIIGNVVRSPKTLLGQPKVFVEGVARSPVDIVADVIRFVREEAIRLSSSDQAYKYDKVVVTIPVNMIGRRRQELREAFRMAGVGIMQFVHEPLTALYGHLRSQADIEAKLRKLNRELVLVFDWGGGTLDLTLCQVICDMLFQIENDGCSDVGGDHIDEAIRNTVIANYRGVPMTRCRCLRSSGCSKRSGPAARLTSATVRWGRCRCTPWSPGAGIIRCVPWPANRCPQRNWKSCCRRSSAARKDLNRPLIRRRKRKHHLG